MTNPALVHTDGALGHHDLPGVKIYLAYVGPEEAARWLGRNYEGQRRISLSSTNKYGSEMAQRQWLFTGDPVRFNRDGQLIDGQHRLTAIVESNETQLLMVIEGLDHDTMAAIDSGRRRSYPDFLRMQGIGDHTAMAALVLRMWHWDHGNFLPHLGRVVDAPWVRFSPSTQDLEATRTNCVRDGLHLEKACAFARYARNKFGKRSGVMNSIWGFSWSLFTLVDPELRDLFFFELVEESKETKPTYAVNALRNKINRTSPGDLTDTEWLQHFISTWNAWRKGEEIGTLRMPSIISPNSLAYPLGLEERYVA